MKNTIRKIISITIAIAMLFTFASCGESSDDSTLNIAVVKQMDHPSLDEIANAITAELD